MEFGREVRAARKKKGLTQKELGEQVGVTAIGVAQWEKGLRYPRLEMRQRLAKALDMDVTVLMSDDEKQDYFDLFGTEEERAQRALTEIKKRIMERAAELEMNGGVATPATRRAWTLELVKDTAPRYYVSPERIRQKIGMDSYDEPFSAEASSNSPVQVTDKVVALLGTMNADGCEAALRHIQELSKIPDYKKV